MLEQNDHLQRSGGLWCSIHRVISQSLAGRFFGRACAVRVDFDRCAVKAEAIDGNPDHVVLLKRIEQPIQNARVGPSAHARVNGVPLAKPFRQSTPFAAILGDKENGVDHG